MLSTSPPAQLRARASHEEAAGLTRALGARVLLSTEDAAALLDPRGRRFQRLEWLGDALLDHITAHHRVLVSAAGEGCCTGTSHADLVSDDDLSLSVAESPLLDLLDWTPSPGRRADLVEACVAAAWSSGGWADAVHVAAAFVHPAFSADVDVLVLGSDPEAVAGECSSASFRRLATLGSHVLEAAASTRLVGLDPGDEAALSSRRRPLLAGARLLRHASALGAGCPSRDPHHLVDHVQAHVGLVQLRAGAARAVAVGQELVFRGART